jgi:oligopeptide transport system ATP-binding protein
VLTLPRHPYTEGLLASLPRGGPRGERLEPITGSPPSLARVPVGCAFHPRCPRARDRCAVEIPPLFEIAADRASACFYAEEVGRAPG